MSTSPAADKYRGAVVEDLQLSPAFCLPETANIASALEAAYEREFDYLPVLNQNRKPIGYLDVTALKSKFEEGLAKENDTLRQHTTLFLPSRSLTSKSYTIIHPLTPLSELESFLAEQKGEFALVTDQGRRWVLAVATLGDLERMRGLWAASLPIVKGL